MKLTKAQSAAALLGSLGGKIGGKANTPAQNAARARNGRKGGRPRSTHTPECAVNLPFKGLPFACDCGAKIQ